MTDYISDDQLKRAFVDAQRQLEHDRRMAQFEQEFVGMSGQVMRDAAVGTAGAAVGTVVITAGMIASRRFRYVVQLILHIPMSFFVTFTIASQLLLGDKTMPNSVPDDELESRLINYMATSLIVAFIGCVAWTTAYGLIRTRKKWRTLTELEIEAQRAQYCHQPQPPYGSQYY